MNGGRRSGVGGRKEGGGDKNASFSLPATFYLPRAFSYQLLTMGYQHSRRAYVR